MRKGIPEHRHDDLSENGIHLKIVTMNDVGSRPIEYAHRDDYFILGILVRGELRYELDFKQLTAKVGEIHFILPGQVHRFVGCDDFEGWMMIVEDSLISDHYRKVFEKASIRGETVKYVDKGFDRFKSIYEILQTLIGSDVDNVILRDMVAAYAGLFSIEFQNGKSDDIHFNDRHLEIVMKLKTLIETDMQISHSPSYYAGKINISTVYLNEAVNSVTGNSTSDFVRSELILRAKRLLYHSDMTVKEIAQCLGFEDNAYFTRLFTKSTGISPLKFRQKH